MEESSAAEDTGSVERLGHASIAITLDTYSHVLPGLGADAADRFERYVFG